LIRIEKMFTINIPPCQSPKVRQFANTSMTCTLSSESGIAIIRQLENIKTPDIKKIEKKLRSCSQLFDKILPNISVTSTNSFSEKPEIDNITPTTVYNQNRKTLLKKEHWRLKSEISEKTFFENNYSSGAISPTYIRINDKTQSYRLNFSRGFKTIRSDPGFKTSNFDKRSSDTADGIDLKFGENKKSSGYDEGYLAGLAASQANSKNTPESETATKKSNWDKLWSTTNKISTIMFLVVGVIVISQFTGFRFGTRGANEISPEDIEVTFEDVKGCDEAKQELQEIVDFLMNPEKFSSLGGKLPKGCLLEGPPGTGKTLLAKAVAGQAGVPFFQASGSEFDEVLVGQGARRVRDLFKTAKQRAPCVIFIDEIDSVGGKRTSSSLHPYANQTINQLLSEMDGFVSNEGVIVIGATNRKDQLDKALLRPGRFDAEIRVEVPDMKGRKEILELYLSKIKHDSSVDVDKLSKMTIGFTPAELENMVNTAAIRAAVEEQDWVTMSDFEYSHDKQTIGTDWKSRVKHKDDLKITAYHEAGHTLVNIYTDNTHPLHKVTIVAKGQTGGHTAYIPERDASHITKAQMLASIDTAMGGRAAEELIFGKEKITGGASSDLSRATRIAKGCVKYYGMSEKFGLRVVEGSDNNEEFAMSEGTRSLMDAEINRLLNDGYKNAMNILKAHRRELDLLADALLKYETLDSDDVKAIIEGNTKKLAHKNTLSSNSKILFKNPTPSNSIPKGTQEDIGPTTGGVMA